MTRHRPGRRAWAGLAVSALAWWTTPAQAQPSTGCRDNPRAARVLVGTGAVAANAALYVYFRNAWWSGEKADHLFINWERGLSFRGQDKLGHFVGGYHLTRLGSDLLRAACVGDARAVWWGAAYAAAFQLQIELWDGRQKAYGFSPPDLIANTAGAGFSVAQHYVPPLRHVKPTISYNPTAAYRTGQGALRPTVDYSGQTYWLSTDVDALLPERARGWWPDVVRVSVGHSITDWVDPRTGVELRARRKFVLSLDLDPEALPGSNRYWRVVKHQLSYYRFPAPALELTPSLRGIAWYR